MAYEEQASRKTQCEKWPFMKRVELRQVAHPGRPCVSHVDGEICSESLSIQGLMQQGCPASEVNCRIIHRAYPSSCLAVECSCFV